LSQISSRAVFHPARPSTACPAIMDQSAADTWHSIRPWIHRFALSVDQVSSVSATFTLKSALSAKPLDPILESLVEDERGDTSCAPTDSSTRPRAVSDALTQGLSVKVNSSPWQRVLLKVNEECDEAIIIVFGLMPGRQYDVELGITHQEESLRSHIITNDACVFSLARVFSSRTSPLNFFYVQLPIRRILFPLGIITSKIT